MYPFCTSIPAFMKNGGFQSQHRKLVQGWESGVQRPVQTVKPQHQATTKKPTKPQQRATTKKPTKPQQIESKTMTRDKKIAAAEDKIAKSTDKMISSYETLLKAFQKNVKLLKTEDDFMQFQSNLRKETTGAAEFKSNLINGFSRGDQVSRISDILFEYGRVKNEYDERAEELEILFLG